jgi:hypothetical protein
VVNLKMCTYWAYKTWSFLYKVHQAAALVGFAGPTRAPSYGNMGYCCSLLPPLLCPCRCCCCLPMHILLPAAAAALACHGCHVLSLLLHGDPAVACRSPVVAVSVQLPQPPHAVAPRQPGRVIVLSLDHKVACKQQAWVRLHAAAKSRAGIGVEAGHITCYASWLCMVCRCRSAGTEACTGYAVSGRQACAHQCSVVVLQRVEVVHLLLVAGAEGSTLGHQLQYHHTCNCAVRGNKLGQPSGIWRADWTHLSTEARWIFNSDLLLDSAAVSGPNGDAADYNLLLSPRAAAQHSCILAIKEHASVGSAPATCY